MMAVRRGSPFSGPSLPRSSTFLRKHWPSWVTIIRVDSSSLKAHILLLWEGMLYFFTARSPSPWRSKSFAKNLARKKWDSHTWIINSNCKGWSMYTYPFFSVSPSFSSSMMAAFDAWSVVWEEARAMSIPKTWIVEWSDVAAMNLE